MTTCLRLLLAFAILAITPSCAAESSAPRRVEDSLTFIFETASYPIEAERCASSLRTLLEKAERGEEVAALVRTTRNAGCLDRHSLITEEQIGACSPIQSSMQGDVLLLQFRSFCTDTPMMIAMAIEEQPIRPRKLVLDLRSNTGGSFQGSIGTAALFAPASGVPIITILRKGRAKEILADAPGDYADIKVIAITNRHTASGAELLLGAMLVWWDEFHVVGTRTYGKGSFQNTSKLGTYQLAITAGQFVAGDLLRPLHIEGIGIFPTIPMDEDRTPDEVLEMALHAASLTR